jgi:hypothetical protein
MGKPIGAARNTVWFLFPRHSPRNRNGRGFDARSAASKHRLPEKVRGAQSRP